MSMMPEELIDKSFIDNEHLFIGKGKLTDEDKDATMVSDAKVWKQYGKLYKCGNCGYLPTFVDISEWKRCPKCEVLKTFFEKDGNLFPTFDIEREAIKYAPDNRGCGEL